MRKILLFAPLLTCLLFSGCSWQELFVVFNRSTSSVQVSYRLAEPEAGTFNIFDAMPDVYKLNSKGTIDWEGKLSPTDEDPDPLVTRVAVPPNCAMIFGRLSNSNYENHKQEFINSRVFNLKQIVIRKGGDVTRISAKEFDNHFKKDKNRYISYTVE